MSFREFLLRRLIRLYPMIIAGSVAGLFSSIGRYELYHHHIQAYSYIVSFLYSLIILPQISVTPFGSQIFPLNTVIWSLFFELIANILYGLFLFKSPSCPFGHRGFKPNCDRPDRSCRGLRDAKFLGGISKGGF